MERMLDLNSLQFYLTLIGTVAGIVSAIVVTCYKLFKKYSQKSAEEQQMMFITLLDEFGADLDVKLKKINSDIVYKHELVRQASVEIIRDSINEAHQIWAPQGKIPAHILLNIENLFAHYGDLGGNSYVETLMKDIRALEVIHSGVPQIGG